MVEERTIKEGDGEEEEGWEEEEVRVTGAMTGVVKCAECSARSIAEDVAAARVVMRERVRSGDRLTARVPCEEDEVEEEIDEDGGGVDDVEAATMADESTRARPSRSLSVRE